MKKYIVWGFFLLPLGFFIHAILAFSTLPKAERTQVETNRQIRLQAKYEQNAKKVDNYLFHLASIAKNMPRTMNEVSCREKLQEPIHYVPVDKNLLIAIASRNSDRDKLSGSSWYRAAKVDGLVKAILKEKMTPDDADEMAGGVDELEKYPYTVVLAPENIFWPAISGDQLIPGYFDGGAFVFDNKDNSFLCSTVVSVKSSSVVESHTVKVAHFIEVYNGSKNAAEEDFLNNFWAALNQSLTHLNQKQ